MVKKAASTKKQRASTAKSRAEISTKASVRKIRNDIKAKKPKAPAKKACAAKSTKAKKDQKKEKVSTQKGGWGISDSGTRKKEKKSCKGCTKLEWWA